MGIDAAFWELLGGEGDIKSAADVVQPGEDVYGEGVLYTLSDDSGSLTQTEVARGDLKTDMLTPTMSCYSTPPKRYFCGWVRDPVQLNNETHFAQRCAISRLTKCRRLRRFMC